MHVHVPEQYLCVAQIFVLESLAKRAIVNNGSHIRLSVTCRPTVGQQATDTLPTHYQQSADTVK